MEQLSFTAPLADLESLKRALAGIEGLAFPPSQESSKEPARHVLDRSLPSDVPVLATLALAFGARIGPALITSIRDVVVEHLRARKRTLTVKYPGGRQATYSGTSAEDMERLLEDFARAAKRSR